MPIPSVQSIAPAILFLIFFSPGLRAQTTLQGRWECSTKSGRFDAQTQYAVQCGGALHFKNDRILESTCVDGFFPSGVYWEMFDNRLTLRDSAGKAFADYEVRNLGAETMQLQRNGVLFEFRRAESGAGSTGR
jgi:hypothetical protein